MNFRTIFKKANFASVIILVLLIPFSSQWITYFIGLWVLTWILEGEFKLKAQKMRDWKLWLPISIIIVNIISVFYSFDKATGFSIVQTQISQILIPLVFISVNQNYKRKKNDIFLTYIIGVFLLSVFLFYNTIYLNRLLFSNNLNLNNVLAITKRLSSNYAHPSYLSLHISLAIVFVINLMGMHKKRIIVILLFLFLIIVYSLAIIILNSRAALIVLVILILFSLFKFLKNVKFWLRSLIFLLFTILFSYLILQSRLSNNISWIAKSFNIKENVNNLYFNGDFKDELTNWEASYPDSINHELIDTKYGKAIRIKKSNEVGRWSLKYKGRGIYYHKDLTYKIHFKYRVLKGDEIPFKIGWGALYDSENCHDLHKEIIPLEQGWYDCIVQYKFNSNHQNPNSFLHSQLPNTIIDIADIELTCNDTLDQIMFVDQMRDVRFSLWENAVIVWKEKLIFGQGIGDSKDRLLEVHKERNIEDAVKKKYNCHNQFLETATQTGLVGLAILLLVFAIPFYQSIKKKQELLFLFLMICFINFMFESMLQRLAGVVFFAFWYSFLWFVYYRDEDKEETTSSSNQK